MKTPIAYYLLLLYCTALCRPILPAVQDFIAHALFEHKHITSVHTQNGKDHLDIELGDAAKENGAQNNTKSTSFDTVTVHYPVETQVILPAYKPFLVHAYYDPLSNLPFAFAAIQLPPPRRNHYLLILTALVHVEQTQFRHFTWHYFT